MRASKTMNVYGNDEAARQRATGVYVLYRGIPGLIPHRPYKIQPVDSTCITCFHNQI